MAEKGSKNGKLADRRGYRWRDELIENLLPYIRDEVDVRCLRNAVRGFVPHFSPTLLDPSTAPWFYSWEVHKLHNKWWKPEIEAIGRELAKSPTLNDSSAKPVFEKYGWDTDRDVAGIAFHDRTRKWKFDAYKDRVAVEIELSSRVSVFKDAFKFLVGQAMNQIDVGIVVVRYHREKHGYPYWKSVDYDSHPICSTLPMLTIAFFGFGKE